jgi:thioredoxin-related protein
MYAIRYFIFVFSILIGASACTNNSLNERSFELYTMAKAQKMAEAEQKKIVVHVYTDWCAWCKKLEREVYTDVRIGDVVNEYFYAVRLNAESDEEIIFNGRKISMRDLSQSFGVKTYPGTVFIDSNGQTIGQQTGYMEVEVFEKLLAYVGSSAYKSIQFDDFSVTRLPYKSGTSSQSSTN